MSIRLGDGRFWTLPTRRPTAMPHAEYRALLGMFEDIESEAEQDQAELALTIGLLRHAHGVGPDELDALLGFEQHHPQLRRLQHDLHALAERHLTRRAIVA